MIREPLLSFRFEHSDVSHGFKSLLRTSISGTGEYFHFPVFDTFPAK